MFIHFDADSRGECNDCGSQGTIMHLLLTRTNGGVDLCVGCFGALALACKLAAGKLRLLHPLGCPAVDREEVLLAALFCATAYSQPCRTIRITSGRGRRVRAIRGN